MFNLKDFFYYDRLSLIMIVLVSFIALIVFNFSKNYLHGDRKQRHFWINLFAISISLLILVGSNHFLIFLTSWALSNWLLTQLMQHKAQWVAAKNASKLALKNFTLAFVFLSGALLIVYKVTGLTSIQAILKTPLPWYWNLLTSFLIVLAAMCQSALWPFHRWLTSSLNSPTPVSALMHAGFINGGGFLLLRFSPLLSQDTATLTFIFIIGVISAILGTLWKLLQSDVKRMLACSTKAQMGFMFAQCGLGLFPAAMAHLCLHSFFKAYLFLSSGSAAKEQGPSPISASPNVATFLTALICGLSGAFVFAIISGKSFLADDTSLFLVALAAVACTQLALSLIGGELKRLAPIAFILTLIFGAIYGLSILMMTHLLAPVPLPPPPIHDITPLDCLDHFDWCLVNDAF